MEASPTWVKQIIFKCFCNRGENCKYECLDSTCPESKTIKRNYCRKCMTENLHPHSAIEITDESTWKADEEKLNRTTQEF